MFIINDREVVDVQVDDVCSWDYPDFCDAHFSHAVFADTGEELSEEEMEQLNNEYPEALWEMAYDSLVD